MRTNLGRNKKILLLCLSPLGDTLFATPAIRALRDAHPAAEIVVVASRLAGEVLRNNPYRLKIYSLRDQWAFWRCLARIREARYDLALGFSQVGSFFTRFCAAREWSDFFLIHPRAGEPVIDLCMDVLQSVGITPGNVSTQTEIWWTERAEQVAEKLLAGSGWVVGTPLLAIHPGGHYFARKRWAVEQFIALLRILRTQWDGRIVLIGGAEDVPATLAIRSGAPELISAVGMLRINESAALLHRCQMFIGNDSGPLHLAAAVGVPTIGLFGPTSPREFFPYEPPHTYIYKEMNCSPCYRFRGGIWQYLPRCTRARCMDAIGVADVLAALDKRLSHTQFAGMGRS